MDEGPGDVTVTLCRHCPSEPGSYRGLPPPGDVTSPLAAPHAHPHPIPVPAGMPRLRSFRMGTLPSPRLARPGPAPALRRGTRRFPCDCDVGTSKPFQLGFSRIFADISWYLPVLTGRVPPCHLHLSCVPPPRKLR